MPYDYEYLTRLGWDPRNPSDRARQREAPQPRGHYGKGPKGYTRSDERIFEDVCERLRADMEVDATELSVTVRSGEVTLEGRVPDRFQEHRAIEVAESVRGVCNVTSHLNKGRPRPGGPS
jgi:osmotically-inducible protein OsmY